MNPQNTYSYIFLQIFYGDKYIQFLFQSSGMSFEVVNYKALWKVIFKYKGFDGRQCFYLSMYLMNVFMD